MVKTWLAVWFLRAGPLEAAVTAFSRLPLAGFVLAGEWLLHVSKGNGLLFALTAWSAKLLPHPRGSPSGGVSCDWSWVCCGLVSASCSDAIL